MEKTMKKIFLFCLLSLFLTLNVHANNFPNLKYKNIANKDKISFNPQTGIWSKKHNNKSEIIFTKTKGFGEFYDYLDTNKNFAFSTDCEYEFIYNDSLIGYSGRDMKFYDINFNNGLSKRAMSQEEVETMFPDYKIISLSSFSKKTNSLKIKKHLGDLKIILLNDTDKTFDNFYFTSGNAKFEQYSLKGFLTVKSSGMIQFSDKKDPNGIWYVLLVR